MLLIFSIQAKKVDFSLHKVLTFLQALELNVFIIKNCVEKCPFWQRRTYPRQLCFFLVTCLLLSAHSWGCFLHSTSQMSSVTQTERVQSCFLDFLLKRFELFIFWHPPGFMLTPVFFIPNNVSNSKALIYCSDS